MSNYYVSGCVSDGDNVSICDDSAAQFWTLYHRNDDGLSEGIIDCVFREDAEAAMRVYEHRDALAASFDELAKAVGWSVEQCEQTGESPMDAAVSLVNLISELQNDAYLNSVRAEGVEMCIASCDASVNSGEDWPPLGSMREIARALRAGEPS